MTVFTAVSYTHLMCIRDSLGVVPHDEGVYRFDCGGKPIVQLPKDSPVRMALKEIVEKLGL